MSLRIDVQQSHGQVAVLQNASRNASHEALTLRRGGRTKRQARHHLTLQLPVLSSDFPKETQDLEVDVRAVQDELSSRKDESIRPRCAVPVLLIVLADAKITRKTGCLSE